MITFFSIRHDVTSGSSRVLYSCIFWKWTRL